MTQVRPSVIVIVPCYNEEHRFPSARFLDFAAETPGIGFLFVDDGSSDRTAEVLSELAAKQPGSFRVLRMAKNSGKAEAVRAGFVDVMESGVPYLAFWDADLATPLEAIPDFLKIFDSAPRLEMVLGARVKLMGRDIRRRMVRHYLGRVFATCASFVLGLSIYDTQCGAKMFRVTDVLRRIFSEPFGSKWIFDVEILARYLKETGLDGNEAERVIYEHPLLSWADVKGSKVKPVDFFRAFGELLRIGLRYSGKTAS